MAARKKSKSAYAAAGVNLEVSNSLKSGLGRLLKARPDPRCSARSVALAVCSR